VTARAPLVEIADLVTDPTTGRPLLVELVGPAGAGKSAVRRAISELDPSAQPGLPISWQRSLLPVLREGLGMVSEGLELLKYQQPSWWLTMRHLLRVRALERVFAGARAPATTILLDEGPVYGLCRVLLELGFGTTTGITAPPLVWRRSLGRWMGELDLVVWLDAPDDVLTQRIRERPKEHRVKQSFDSEAHEFLRRYRAAYMDVLGRLRNDGKLTVVEMDTGRRSVADVAAGVRSALSRLREPTPPASGREA
jgi:shikimate kinase